MNTAEVLEPDAQEAYGRALRVLTDRRVPYLVGGAWAMSRLAGVRRHTKDLDLFCRPVDLGVVLDTLAESGYRTELLSPVWLAKAWLGTPFIDVIFSSGNGIATVDDVWFEYAVADEALGVPVLLCPVEETIWSKAWIMERDRYDGADVAHLLRAHGATLDWARLLARFGSHWRVLLGHLVLFGYIYPSERGAVPEWVMGELAERLRTEAGAPAPAERVCRGPLLSCRQYQMDLQILGYEAPDETAIPRIGSGGVNGRATAHPSRRRR